MDKVVCSHFVGRSVRLRCFDVPDIVEFNVGELGLALKPTGRNYEMHHASVGSAEGSGFDYR